MRCEKCNGCVSSFNQYRPEYCLDNNCPQGPKEPEEERLERKERLDMLFKRTKGNKD